MKVSLVQHWNSYLSLFPSESIDVYFEEKYVKLYENKNEEAVCFVYEEDKKVFIFPFLRRRFEFEGETFYDFETAYGYGGPIANVRDEVFYKKALDSFKEYCTNNDFIAGFIRFHPLLDNYKFFNNIGIAEFNSPTVAIDLTLNENDLWMKEIHTKNRNVIKKAIKSGLTFTVDKEFKYLNEFRKLYDSTMEKVNAENFYYFPVEYYHKFKLGIENSFLGLVFLENKIISAAIFFYSKDYGHYHLSGSDINYLKYSPNNLMLYAAAMTLKSFGVKKFHLGGGSTTDTENSLFLFKKKFSKSIYDYYIGKIVFNQNIYDKLCNEWNHKNHNKKKLYGHRLLKYKY